MRVIAGTARSLPLKTVEGLDTRPTQDRIKETLFNGKCKILKIENAKHVEIKFLDTGFRKVTSISKLKSGTVKDPTRKRIYGVGCIGSEYDRLVSEYGYKLVRKMYVTWKNMLSRCYNEKHKNYNLYGGSGVYVVHRWLNFSKFFKDAIDLKNFDKEDFLNNEITLDKDKKQRNVTIKKYGKSTCVWLTIKEQNELIDFEKAHEHEKKSFCIVDDYGNKHIVTGIRKFARDNNVTESCISGFYRGKTKKFRGYKIDN